MKTIQILLALAVLGCGSPIAQNTVVGNEASVKTKTISSKTPTIEDNVKGIVNFLASDNLNGRDTGSDGIAEAANFIENRFKANGINPYFNSYRDNFKANDLDAFNVVGFLEGNDPQLKQEVIILGAHYDHIGSRVSPENGDNIGNGANDNASGTATVIALAEYFGTKKNNKRSIIFALFSAEELGLLGSKHLAKRLKDENLNLYTMINFEMVGVPFTDRDYDAFVTGYEVSNMAEKMNDYAGYKIIGFSEVAKKYNLFKQSDNYAFYNEFMLPCQTVSSCDLSNYDQYHKPGDEADLMDYKHMASLIRKISPVIEKMTNTPTKEIVGNEK